MQFLKKYRFWIAGIVVVVAGFFILSYGWEVIKPIPDNSTFKARIFTFDYPRTYIAEEYAPGVVSVGNENKDGGLDPLIEINRYQSDPDVERPGSYTDFIKLQAAALCGGDGPIESITCTEIGVAPFTNQDGSPGQKLNLTLVRKNIKTGTTTSSTYGPMYVFNTTRVQASTTPDNPFRYSAIFVYPSLSAFVNQATTSPVLMDQIISTLVLATTTNVR